MKNVFKAIDKGKRKAIDSSSSSLRKCNNCEKEIPDYYTKLIDESVKEIRAGRENYICPDCFRKTSDNFWARVRNDEENTLENRVIRNRIIHLISPEGELYFEDAVRDFNNYLLSVPAFIESKFPVTLKDNATLSSVSIIEIISTIKSRIKRFINENKFLKEELNNTQKELLEVNVKLKRLNSLIEERVLLINPEDKMKVVNLNFSIRDFSLFLFKSKGVLIDLHSNLLIESWKREKTKREIEELLKEEITNFIGTMKIQYSGLVSDFNNLVREMIKKNDKIIKTLKIEDVTIIDFEKIKDLNIVSQYGYNDNDTTNLENFLYYQEQEQIEEERANQGSASEFISNSAVSTNAGGVFDLSDLRRRI